MSLLANPIVNSVLTALIGEKKNKLLVIGLFKFGILATLRGRLPTKDDVKKKKKGKKEKNVEKERLSKNVCNIRMYLLLRKRENEIRTIQFYI